jgi:hypothetical protein
LVKINQNQEKRKQKAQTEEQEKTTANQRCIPSLCFRISAGASKAMKLLLPYCCTNVG